jgi:hypothetical protein
MGFDELHREMLGLSAAEGGTTSAALRTQVDVVTRLARMPAFMLSVRLSYEAAPAAVKPVLKRRLKALLGRLAHEVLRSPDDGLYDVVREVVHKVRLHEGHSHPDVRRWAETCAAVADDESVRVMAAVADSYPELRDLTRATLSYLVSECNRLGAPVLALRG